MTSMPLRHLLAWDSALRSVVARLEIWIERLWGPNLLGAGHPAGDLFVAWTDLTVGLGLARGAEPEMGRYSVLGQLAMRAAALTSRLWIDLHPPPALARAPE
jgi:hypothetical protein